MTAYATFTDLEHALDTTILAQLCGDGGQPMPGPNPITDAALEFATAAVRAYIRVGDIYTEAEITALDSAHDPLLVHLVVDLATEWLFQPRPQPRFQTVLPAQSLVPRLKQVLEHTSVLRTLSYQVQS